MVTHQKQFDFMARCPWRSGFSLTEVMVTILIVMILVTGAMGYQYSSARDVKIAEVQASAARLGLLLLEGWKGQQGDTGFDAAGFFSGELTIQTSTDGPAIPLNASGGDLTLLGRYEVVINNVTYYVTLSYEDANGSEPMLLSAGIAWRRDYTAGTLDGTEKTVQYSTYLAFY